MDKEKTLEGTMGEDSSLRRRRSIRLADYDYAQAGAYFVTNVAQERGCFFGEIIDGEMSLNAAGVMVEKWWHEINHKYGSLETDEYVIMPNHFHGILLLVGADLRVGPAKEGAHTGAPLQIGPGEDGAPVGADLRVGPVGTGAHTGAPLQGNPPLSQVVQWFKTMTTNAYINGVKQSRWRPFPGKLWQRNYYEHIIRNDKELDSARQYILNNPAQWSLDQENPSASSSITS